MKACTVPDLLYVLQQTVLHMRECSVLHVERFLHSSAINGQYYESDIHVRPSKYDPMAEEVELIGKQSTKECVSTTPGIMQTSCAGN